MDFSLRPHLLRPSVPRHPRQLARRRRAPRPRPSRGTTSSSWRLTPSRGSSIGFLSCRSTCTRPNTRWVSTGPRRCSGPHALCRSGRRLRACDHLDCHRSPFLVVFLCAGPRRRSPASTRRRQVYGADQPLLSSAVPAPPGCVPSALVGNALHFMSGKWGRSKKILKHVLGTQEISLIHLPHKPYNRRALMTMADGSLGFVAVDGSNFACGPWCLVPMQAGH